MGSPKKEAIEAASFASRAEDDDPIDLAVLSGRKAQGKDDSAYRVQHFLPFDPVHKRTEATVEGLDGRVFRTSKGAPQVILGISANAEMVQADVDKAIDDFAARGYRALGVARTDGNDQMAVSRDPAIARSASRGFQGDA